MAAVETDDARALKHVHAPIGTTSRRAPQEIAVSILAD
jgi:xanthine/CO dehydrogenase XdhC/CoxF family maturation factor